VLQVSGSAPSCKRNRGFRMCAPASYSLMYFPITALGEPIRMALAMGGLEFEDKRVPGTEWGELKASTPYGQMPVLTVTEEDGSVKQMAQCRSILRYLGKIISCEGKPLYPTDPFLAFKCDEVMDLVEDCRMKFMPTFSIKDEAEKQAARLALVSEGGSMIPALQHLEDRLGGTWATGDAVSIADLYVTAVLAIFEQPTFLDGFPEKTYASFPNILKCREMVISLAPLKDYYKDAEGIRSHFKAA